jgi:hemolysin activation/secretion protein
VRRFFRLKNCILILIILIVNCNPRASAQTSSPPPLPTFKVKRVEINGSSILKPAELKSLTTPLVGQETNLEQILQLRTAITNLYVKKGYTTSGAFFPVQDSSDGVVRIQVIEGELESIEISELKRLNKNYVESRLKLAADKPLNIRNLEKAIQLLQQNLLIDSVDAQLISGSAPGLSILRLELVEAPSVTTQLTVANDESPNIGEYRATAAIAHQNLFGFGDRLTAEYGLTEGLDRYSLSYSLPINARDGNLFVSYKNNDSEITREPFSPIDLRAESRSVSFGYRQPIIKTPENELALSLALDLRENESFVERESFSFEPDRLGEPGESKISALRFTQEWLSRSPKNVLAASSQFSVGINAFDATVRDTGADGQFFAWLGQLQWLSALNNKRDALLVASLATQATPDSLLSIEQFAIGGLGSVRGYEQNQSIGDNGIFGSVELRTPLIRDSDGIGLIQLAPFFDVGTVWGDREQEEENNTLASWGLGINWELGETLNAQVYYGIPLIDVEEQDDSLQSDGINFSIRLTPLKF